MTTSARLQETRARASKFTFIRDPDRLATAGFAVLLILAIAYIMHRGAGNTFFYDEWGWIETKRSGLHPILAADNGHMLILQTALYQLLFHTVGLNHYWVFRATGVTTHAILLTTMFAYGRRRIGAPAMLIALIPVAFLGSGWQFILWGAAGSGFILSIAFFLMALMALERRTARADLVACGLLVFGLLWSDYMLAFLVGVALELLWRKPRLRQVWIWGVPLILYLVWYAAYHQSSTSISHNLTAAPSFGLDSMAAAAAGLLGLDSSWAEPLGVAFVIGIAWRVLRMATVEARLIALLVAGAGYWMLLGLGRAQLSDPAASRYVYVGAVFIVLIAVEAMVANPIGPRALAIGALVALVALAGNIVAFDGGEAQLSASSVQVRAELGALALARATAPVDLVLDSHWAPQIIAGPWLAATRALHSTAADTAPEILAAPDSARAAADATLVHAGALTVTAAPSRPVRAQLAPGVEGAHLGVARRRGGCVRFQPSSAQSTVDVQLPPTGVVVHARGPDSASVQARRFAPDFENAPVASVAGDSTAIEIRAVPDSSLRPWWLQITPHSDTVRACTVG